MPVITMFNLGSNGRLGNQMFQHAVLLGMSHRHNLVLAHAHRNNRLISVFDLTVPTLNDVSSASSGTMITIREPKFSYTPNIIHTTTFDINLDGYFQTDKYWKEYSSIIREQFVFKDSTIDETAKNCIESLACGLPTVSIGVRRTDYLQHFRFHGLDLEYYERAIATMHERIGKAVYLIVSDDPVWCKEYFSSRYSHYGTFYVVAEHFSHPTSDLVELSIMKQSNHVIMANSSFHWWGAWLNTHTDKIIVFPDKWFGPAGPKDYQDIGCEGWIKC